MNNSNTFVKDINENQSEALICQNKFTTSTENLIHGITENYEMYCQIPENLISYFKEYFGIRHTCKRNLYNNTELTLYAADPSILKELLDAAIEKFLKAK